MRFKHLVVVVLAISLVLGTAVAGFAEGYCGSRSKSKGMDGKFCKMVKMICTNQDELGISDDQMENDRAWQGG